MGKNKKKTIAITYGTFDMFHIGHLKLLQRIKDMCDYLIVAVSTDEFNKQKGKKILIPYKQRALIVKNIKCVNKVIAENSWEQKKYDIKKYDVNLLVMGDDWNSKFDFLSKYCKIIYIPRTQNISTTKLKKSLSAFLSVSKEDILKAFEVIEILKQDFK
jgi:glycerol-3-phosphate cytidylyltransferase